MAKSKGKNSKTCFVIAPIGKEETETRRRSDQVLSHIVEPVAGECGYATVRADHISEPGIITSQVIEHLVDDELVVADLTDHNPNVFYELAVRHAVRKPIIQIIQEGQVIPFDVAQSRTIHLNHRDLDSVGNCKQKLKEQIESIEENPENVDNPISVAVDLKSLRQSQNPLEKNAAETMSMLQEILSEVKGSGIPDVITESRAARLNELEAWIDRLAVLLQLPNGEEPTRETLKEATMIITQMKRVVNTHVWELGYVALGSLDEVLGLRPATPRLTGYLSPEDYSSYYRRNIRKKKR